MALLNLTFDPLVSGNGWVGVYSKTHKSVVETRPNISGTAIRFGMPLMYDPIGDDSAGLPKGVKPVDNTMTDANVEDVFAGFALAVVKANLIGYYNDIAAVGGVYYPNEAVSVFQEGHINVYCPNDDPEFGDPVYVRTVANGVRQIGDVENTSVAGENVLIPRAKFMVNKDAKGVIQIAMLERVNV